MRQQGFLVIAAIVLVVIVGLISAVAVSLLTATSRAANNQLSATQAFYLAYSGLNVGRRAIISGTACNNTLNTATAINSTGVFNWICNANVNSTLNGAITTTTTTIPLASVSGFPSIGTATIDSESITYNGINTLANTLLNATRGANGTMAAIHTSGTTVNLKNEYVITATAGVPTLTTTTTSSGTITAAGRRVLRQGFSIGNKMFSVGNNSVNGAAINPALAFVGSVNVNSGSIVQNLSVTSSSNNFYGSTVIASSTVNVNGTTQVANSLGVATTSSTSQTNPGDVIRNSSLINTNNMFSLFFNNSKTNVKAAANQTYTSSNINGVNGSTAPLIWITNNAQILFNANTTIGTLTSPVILVLDTQNANFSNGDVVYGLVYVTGSVSCTGNVQFYGTVVGDSSATTGNFSTGNAGGVYYSASVINALSPTYLNLTGATINLLSLQEVFQ